MEQKQVAIGGAPSVRDAIRGSLIGGAAGDALGYAIEFMKWPFIEAKYGEKGITAYCPDPRSGEALISDDTQMTLFTAVGLLYAETLGVGKGVIAPAWSYIAMAYLDWLYTQEISFDEAQKMKERTRVSWLLDIRKLYERRAPGSTCVYTLQKEKDEERKLDYIATQKNHSKGCGGVMRVAPIGLYSGGLCEGGDAKQAAILAAQAAAVTHGHPLGYISAAAMAYMVSRAVYARGQYASFCEIVAEVCDALPELFPDKSCTGEMIELLEHAMELAENGDTDHRNIRRLGEGWVGEEALAIAVYCALRHPDDLSAAIIAAVNHSGDSDSTGAITGNIVGALVGYDAIDDKWKQGLELHDVILEVADDLWRGCPSDPEQMDADWARKYGEARWKDE